MNEDKWKRIEKLYDVSRSGALAPKRSLLGVKCPKCGGKVSKDVVKEIVFLGDAGNPEGADVIKRILADTKLEPAVYNMAIAHYTCQCGYEFAKADLDPMSE